MTKLFLDPTSLSEKANQLEELNEQLLERINTLNDTEATLASMWEGSAKQEFRTAYSNDSIQMKNFYNAIFVYIAQLRSIINSYNNYESLNIQIAVERRY